MVIIIGFNITAFGREIKLFEREPTFPLSVRMSRVLLFPIDRALVCISSCAGVLFPLFCSLCPTFSLVDVDAYRRLDVVDNHVQFPFKFSIIEMVGGRNCLAYTKAAASRYVEGQWLSGRMPDSRSRERRHESPTHWRR